MSIYFYMMIHCGRVFLSHGKLGRSVWVILWWSLECLALMFSVFYGEVYKGLLWMHILKRHDDFREWDSLESKCHVANRDNCFAQGTVAPALTVLHRMAICSPHVREQQPTWWPIIGKGEKLVQKPGSKPSEINLQELDLQNSHEHTGVHVHTHPQIHIMWAHLNILHVFYSVWENHLDGFSDCEGLRVIHGLKGGIILLHFPAPFPSI